MTEYTEIADPGLQYRVRRRYSAEITALETLGFCHSAFTLESRGPFSALLYLPLLPLMRRTREVLVFPFPLRLAVANVLLVHSEPSSIAICTGMGVKFYTSFSDRSLLISSTIQSHVAIQDSEVRQSNSQIVRTTPCGTLEQAWLSHKRRAAEIEAQGKAIGASGSFADYLDISQREEADLGSRATIQDCASPS